MGRHKERLSFLGNQDRTSTTSRGSYADISVLKRMVFEGRRLRDKLLRKSRRKLVREARSQLVRASDRMIELEPTVEHARRTLAEAEDSYAAARRAAEEARGVLEAAQRERIPEGRTRRRSSASCSDSSSSLGSSPGPPRLLNR